MIFIKLGQLAYSDVIPCSDKLIINHWKVRHLVWRLFWVTGEADK